MKTIRINRGTLLSYNEMTDTVLVDNRPNKNWRPVFISEGGSPVLYGFLDLSANVLHDVIGGTTSGIKKSKELSI